MPVGPNRRRKRILADPLAAFSDLCPTADEGELAALTALWQQLQSLRKRRKATQLQTRSISRRIGEAKRNGEPVDEIKASMRKHSTHLKSIDDELGDVEKRILGFFQAENEAAPDTEKARLDTPHRLYTSSAANLGDITIDLLNSDQSAWNDYVAKNPAATIHHRAEWRQLIRKSYGHESFYFFARDKQCRTVGILPLIRLQSRLFGDLLVSMPYFQRGGAVADHPAIEKILIQAANAHAAALGVDHIEYRDDIPRQALPGRTEKVNMILPLPESPDALWRGFSAKLRAQIRRPQRENPCIRFGGLEYLDDFYKVYARNMRDLGSPPHSKAFIHNILECFAEHSWITVLYLKNHPVAGGFLLGDGNTLEIPLASTVRDVNPISMNMLLYWEVLKFAVNHDYSYFDFGRSSKGSGTFRFKQQWGAQPKQLYWHYWLGEGVELPSLNPSNPKYALAISLWKRMPVTLSRWLGPSIVKNLP